MNKVRKAKIEKWGANLKRDTDVKEAKTSNSNLIKFVREIRLELMKSTWKVDVIPT